MKKPIISILMLLILALGACMKQMSESAMDDKAGFNGSFEHLKQGLPSNWLVYTPNTTGEGDFSITANTSDFVEGKQSLQFLVNSCSDKGGRYSPGIAQEIPAKEDEEYRISFWVKNENTTFVVGIKAVNATEGVEGPVLRSSETISEWKKHEYTYTIPKLMNRLRIEVSVQKPGVFAIDDIKVEKI